MNLDPRGKPITSLLARARRAIQRAIADADQRPPVAPPLRDYPYARRGR